MIHFFKLIRWKNLFIIAYVLLLLKFLLFPSFQVSSQLSNIQFILLLISILCIEAAGNIINDIFDIETDKINKPSRVIVEKFISKNKAQQWYLFTNSLGIVSGIFLCLNIEKPDLSFIFIGTSLLLYYYSKNLKSKPIIGNFTVAFFTAFAIAVIIIFEFNIFKLMPNEIIVVNIILVVSLFAFLLNFIREIVKDIEDINGDYKLKMNTLPIVFGIERTKKTVSVFCVIPIILLSIIIFKYALIYKFTVIYLLMFTLLPLLFIALKFPKLKSKRKIGRYSFFLKIIMFFGINSLILISFHL